ncbi:phage tail tape measure protein [Cellulomonas rhizosphaerae]|uniref:Phage tail tape measure protein n=1 Tax=Cellulomonas rhizosphaerae TaxID=2293719 RepID=A0A413RJP8_9CELL|nr:phage tail tape measure protein [Cellulomonas rhizosphaerae]RHA38744.1 phage tail tape measure protein [Cellulomonas rhizosphaerae]
MGIRSVVIQLRAEVAAYVAGMNSAEQATNRLTTQVGILGAGMLGLAALAVKKFADFDQAMSNVAATGADAKLSIDELRQAALDAGQRTVYSATEAAGAIENLSKAGLSAADILGGALDGSLDLAAAGALSVADAASYTAIALSQFGLEGDKASHVADLLAAGAGKALGDVSDLGMALKQGGLVAHQTGLSIEETTAALAAFAQQGLLGSDAGTSLKTMLQRLTPQSDEAQKQFDKLGISAYDAQGNFVGLAEFAEQLKTKMQDLTPEARNAALSVMFGSDAVRGAGVLFSEGAEGIRKWEMAVNDQGYAADVAATRLDNLKGDLEQLSGAFDTALINMGEGANGPLRSIVQSLTDVINGFSNMNDTAQTAVLAVFGVGGAIALGAAGVGKLVVGINNAKTALVAMGITAKSTAIAVGAVGLAITAATLVMVNWANAQADARARTEEYLDTLDEFGNRTDATLTTINDKLSSKTGGFLEGLFGNDDSLITKAEKYGLVVQDLQGYILGESDAVDRVTDAITKYNAAHDIVDSDNQVAKQNDFTDALDEQASSLSDAEKKAIQKAEADQKAGVAAADAAAATKEQRSAVGQLTDTLATGGTTTDSYTNALKDLVAQQREAAGIVLSQRDAQRQYEQSLDDATKALKDNGRTLELDTQKGRDNQAALDDIAKSGLDVVESMRANGASQKELQKAVRATRADFIAQAEKMGMSKSAAKKLADQLGLIPKKVDVDVAVDTQRATDALNRWITLANGRHVKITVDQVGGKQYQFAPGASIARAEGGPIIGPGTGTSDSILARVSNGEHVITAAEVQAAGGHGAIEAWRSSLRGFATGGRVEWAKNRVADARDAYELANGESKAAARTKDAKRQARAQKALDAAKSELEDAKATYARVVEATRQLRTDARRGDSREQATAGMSGAYSVIDQLADASRNPDLSKKARANLAATAKEAEAGLKRLYAQADKIDAKLQSAADQVSRLADIRDQAASGLTGAFGLGDTIAQATDGTAGSWQSVARMNERGQSWNEQIWDPGTAGKAGVTTSAGIVAAYTKRAAAIKTFVGKLQKLREMGLTGPLLQEIYQLGTEQGTVIADALIKGGKGGVSALNKQAGQIDYWANVGGTDLTKAFYTGGIAAAQGFQKGLESDLANNKKSVAKWAKALELELKRAWGIASPSKVTYGMARFLGKGTELGLIDSMPAVIAAARRFSGAAIPTMASGTGSGAGAARGGVTFKNTQHFYGADDSVARKSEARLRDSVYSGGLHRLATGVGA